VVETDFYLSNPDELFQGTILIIAPHMDDEALACGGIIAKLPQKDHIHIIYATDGMKSPEPIFPSRDSISPDLGEVRAQESKSAMSLLGVPDKNLHFFRMPEARIRKNKSALLEKLLKTINDIKPDIILIPFRYDRHQDHLAINDVVINGLNKRLFEAQIIEYFVYYRWKLLPLQDIRKYIKPQFLIKFSIDDVATQKRKALDCYKSQTTIFYPWQTRAILSSSILDEESQNPEIFLFYKPSYSGTAIFKNAIAWIRIVHYFEPILQRWKYFTQARLNRVFRNYA
jgi:LmbE family N-acetylglucosaminyl deacetylase